MRTNNCRIGFDDRLVMLGVIPVLSFIIPIVFMGCRFGRYPLFTWDKYITTLVITSVLWIGSRQIMIYSRKKYPLFNDVRKRLVFQSVNMLVFTLVFNNLLGYVADHLVFNNAPMHTGIDMLISTNSAAIFCSIMIIAIYESIYLFLFHYCCHLLLCCRPSPHFSCILSSSPHIIFSTSESLLFIVCLCP